LEVFIKHKRSEENIWGSSENMSMGKFEYKLIFESDAENIPDILVKISETIRKELLDKMINPIPIITILDK